MWFYCLPFIYYPNKNAVLLGLVRLTPVFVFSFEWHWETTAKASVLSNNEVFNQSLALNQPLSNEGKTVLFSRSVRWVLCCLNAPLSLGSVGCVSVCAYTPEVMGVSCECVCVGKGWQCLKVMLTVHTQTAPEESTSFVDPLCMFCVCLCCSLVLAKLFAQEMDCANLCKNLFVSHN